MSDKCPKCGSENTEVERERYYGGHGEEIVTEDLVCKDCGNSRTIDCSYG